MLRIIKKGILTSLQTLPQSGWRCYGVSPRGPMDLFAHCTINALLQNPANAASMELHFPAAKMEWLQPARFALGGGDFGALLNGQPVPLWTVQEAQPGDLLTFTALKKGFRAYLGVQGGFDVPLSRYANKIVQDGDVLPIGQLQSDLVATALTHDRSTIYSPAQVLLCLAGPEFDWLTDASKALLETTDFSISPAGNRMGMPLQGAALQLVANGELLSSAVAMGTVQRLPNGQCLVLMADHNTTGGYPRIASVLTSELPKLAQMQPNTTFRIQLVTAATATEKYLSFIAKIPGMTC